MSKMIKLGGKSEIFPDRVVAAISGGGTYGPGTVSRLTGLDTWKRCAILEDARSGSQMSGALIYALNGSGLYSYDGLAISYRSSDSGYFEVVGDEVAWLSRTDFHDAACRLFPAEFEKKVAAVRARAEREAAEAAARERAIAEANAATYGDDEDKAIKIVEDDISITRILPTRVVGATLYKTETFCTLTNKVLKLTGISTWTPLKSLPVNHFINQVWPLIGDGIYTFTLGIQREDKQPEERVGYFEVNGDSVAFIKSERVNAYREVAFADEAKVIADQAASLPVLKGTAKQVAWATRLRSVLASRDPGDATLKRATTASYWIDKRFDLKLV